MYGDEKVFCKEYVGYWQKYSRKIYQDYVYVQYSYLYCLNALFSTKVYCGIKSSSSLIHLEPVKDFLVYVLIYTLMQWGIKGGLFKLNKGHNLYFQHPSVDKLLNLLKMTDAGNLNLNQ